MQDFLTVKEAAEYVGLSIHTLNAYRITGDGPAYFKLGRLVRYDRAQLEQWARRDQRMSTSQAA